MGSVARGPLLLGYEVQHGGNGGNEGARRRMKGGDIRLPFLPDFGFYHGEHGGHEEARRWRKGEALPILPEYEISPQRTQRTRRATEKE
jgi:hypothetical protein